MTARAARLAALLLVILSLSVLAGVLSGCATSEEWGTWKSHGSHFASGTHMGFSLRNQRESQPRVTRPDIARARDEAWWGKPVTVEQDQIFSSRM
jgi:hypothetical protein